MGAAFGWGMVAASSLVIGAIVALLFRIGLRTIGLIMAFGAGVLISAVAFDLVEEAFGMSSGNGWGIGGLFAGCAVFFGGDWLIGRAGGSERKDARGGQESGSSLAIVLGTVLDGVPESMVIGLTIFKGGAVGAAYLIAVFISNLPESISSTSGLLASGWKKARGPLDVDRDRDRLRARVARRLRAVPAFVSGRRRIRAHVRGRSDPHDAREHDDARGLRARGQVGRGRDDDRLRASRSRSTSSTSIDRERRSSCVLGDDRRGSMLEDPPSLRGSRTRWS